MYLPPSPSSMSTLSVKNRATMPIYKVRRERRNGNKDWSRLGTGTRESHEFERQDSVQACVERTEDQFVLPGLSLLADSSHTLVKLSRLTPTVTGPLHR
ncbi:hypothetical protein BVRB_043030, partial [Beta vulgaris subsp. vulgaris]